MHAVCLASCLSLPTRSLACLPCSSLRAACCVILCGVFRLPTVYHSVSPHKEFRFLLPVLPIAHAYAGQTVSAVLAPAGRRRRHRLGNTIAITLFVLHVPAAIYLSVWHQSGALSAVDAVATRIPAVVSSKMAAAATAAAAGKTLAVEGEPAWLDGEPARVGQEGDNPPLVAVHFLMPCHSAPLHSHMHFQGSEGGVWSGKAHLWSLDCSPGLVECWLFFVSARGTTITDRRTYFQHFVCLFVQI